MAIFCEMCYYIVMKNKKLVILLSIFGALVLVILLTSTIFCVRNVSVNWLTTRQGLTALQDESVVKSADVKMGKSIFLLKTEEIAENVERKYPRIKVVSIERKFPNGVVIHVAEREELFSIKINDRLYAIVDSEGKVLETRTDYVSNESGENPINVTLSNYLQGDDDFVVGYMIRSDRIRGIIQKLSTSLAESHYNPMNAKGLFKSININLAYKSTLEFETRYGIQMKMLDLDNYLTEKMMVGIACYEVQQKKCITSGKIVVAYTDANGVVAQFPVSEEEYEK